MVFLRCRSLIQRHDGPLDKVDTTYFIRHCIGPWSYLKIICCVHMRKFVVYITRVLNIKLAISFYISVYMQNQCWIFYQNKLGTNYCYNHQNAYKEVFWLKFQGGTCPQTVRAANWVPRENCAQRANCAPRWNRTAKYHDAFSFFWGKPCYRQIT